MPNAAARLAVVAAANAAGLVNIDDTGFTAEQPAWFWPVAYARMIDLRGAPPPAAASLPVIRLNADALPILLAGSGHRADTLLADAVAARPLASFDLPGRLEAALTVSQRDVTSESVLALLPGTNPALAAQTIVIDAHIDGYGFGEPVNGDGLYNGAFDDAAYVATLVRLAQQRRGKGFVRPLLFAVFTGEEKGLLGSRWFIAHPPVPLANIAATITLDAIRPLFPLKILTVIGSDKSSLMSNVQAVAAPMGITPRPDLEPERGMIDRTDAAPFLKAGIPAVAFMFGYDTGSADEARFRTWYRTRYHKPQDDIGQPIDFTAAADFNHFFGALTQNVADAAKPPAMAP
ncbi:MAG: M28 family peptidase [Sandarakinorhabdus sp.]|nr:M28 family peptidase [Sandarakinorhabdus sp.]